ncbi:RxLR effector protein [Phytophthora megakarya]|uniref:RxLR effector protein n=1 Tax=Phytophthora megakarya TaxID=4795 RepID=A0A225W3X7_9STRA|nr:RxLR effector protein [Phytophthora megakarya]
MQFRYTLLLLVFALVGCLSVVPATRDAEITRAADTTPHSETQRYGDTDTKRMLRNEKPATNADTANPSAGEERAIIVSGMKSAFYRLLKAFGILPQTIYARMGIRSGWAPAIVHRFYHSYSRWYARKVPVYNAPPVYYSPPVYGYPVS